MASHAGPGSKPDTRIFSMGNASSQPVSHTQDFTEPTMRGAPTRPVRASPAPPGRSTFDYEDTDDYLAAIQLQQELGSTVGLHSPHVTTTHTKEGRSNHASNVSRSSGKSKKAQGATTGGKHKTTPMAPSSAAMKPSFQPQDDAPGPLDALFSDLDGHADTLLPSTLTPHFAGSAHARGTGTVQVPNTQSSSLVAANEFQSPNAHLNAIPASSIEMTRQGEPEHRRVTVNMSDTDSSTPATTYRATSKQKEKGTRAPEQTPEPRPFQGQKPEKKKKRKKHKTRDTTPNLPSSPPTPLLMPSQATMQLNKEDGRAGISTTGVSKTLHTASSGPMLPKDRLKHLKARHDTSLSSGLSSVGHELVHRRAEQSTRESKYERVQAQPRRAAGIAAEVQRDDRGRQRLQVEEKVTKVRAKTLAATPQAVAGQFESPGKERKLYTWSSSKSKRRSRHLVPVDPGEKAGPEVGPSAEPPNFEELAGATVALHTNNTPSPAADTDHSQLHSAGSATRETAEDTAAPAAEATAAASLQSSSPLVEEIFAGLAEIDRGTQELMALDFSTPEMTTVPQLKTRKRKSKVDDAIDADTSSGHVPAEEAPVQRKKKKTTNSIPTAVMEPVEASPEPAEEMVSEVKEKKKSKKRASEAVERETPETQPEEVDEPVEAAAPEPADESAEPVAPPKEKKKRKNAKKSEIAEAPAEAPGEQDAEGDSSFVEEAPAEESPAEEPPVKRRSFGRGRKQSATGAEAELAIEHTLSDPPDLRDHGEFTADEAELLRQQIKHYMYSWSLSVQDLVNMIQWTKPYAEGGKPHGTNQQEAQQFAAVTKFWAEIYDTLPKRKHYKAKGGTTAIQRFVRRKYHNFSKGSGGWTDEEDAELAQLYAQYPNSWKKIAEALGDRSESACRDRWRNYVRYGDSRNTAAWSDLELEKLTRSIDAVIEADKNDRIKDGRQQLDQYTSRDINWKFVSDKVGTRSRLQCQMKWRAMQNRPDKEKIKDEKKKAARRSESADGEKKTPKAKAKAKKEAAPTAAKPKAKASPGFEKMRGGDKLDIILALSECAPETEEDIDWKEVKEKEEGSRGGPSPWSKKDRQAVLKELCDAVGEQDDFSTTLNEIALHLQEEYGAEGLEEHYDPSEDVELVEESVQEKSVKRKRVSEAGKEKKRSSKKFKSADIISASDDEE